MKDETEGPGESELEAAPASPEESTPEVEPDDAPETDLPNEPEKLEEPFFQFSGSRGTVTFKSKSDLEEYVREAQHLEPRMTKLGRERQEAIEQREQLQAQMNQIGELMQNDHVRRAMVAAQYGVDPALMDEADGAVVAKIMDSLMPRISKVEEMLSQTTERMTAEEQYRATTGFMSAHPDLSKSPELCRKVADKLDELQPSPQELKTAKGIEKWLGIATALVLQTEKPDENRVRTDKAIREALAVAEEQKKKDRRLASAGQKGGTRSSVGTIDTDSYSRDLKGSTQLTHDALARMRGKST